jgi:hypothetical protein
MVLGLTSNYVISAGHHKFNNIYRIMTGVKVNTYYR